MEPQPGNPYEPTATERNGHEDPRVTFCTPLGCVRDGLPALPNLDLRVVLTVSAELFHLGSAA